MRKVVALLLKLLLVAVVAMAQGLARLLCLVEPPSTWPRPDREPIVWRAPQLYRRGRRCFRSPRMIDGVRLVQRDRHT
jgi:hypothetical protein